MARHIAYLRLVPAAVWLMTQIVMVGSVSTAKAEPAELRALAKLLQVDRITLCNSAQQNQGNGLNSETCPWCQGFSDLVLPTCSQTDRKARASGETRYRMAALAAPSCPAGLAYASRAPPA